jgi:hypothetical protein
VTRRIVQERIARMQQRHAQLTAAIEDCKSGETYARSALSALMAHTEAEGIRGTPNRSDKCLPHAQNDGRQHDAATVLPVLREIRAG